MSIRKLAFLASAILLIFSFAFSQTQPGDTDADKKSDSDKIKKTDPEKDKKKKEMDDRIMQILDAAVSDASTLRLPENRAVVFGISGDLYWKFDEKRSRELFRNAAAEIVIFNQDSEKEKRDSTDPYFEMFDSNDIRSQV